MRIIFKNEDNSIAIITPTEEALSFATIEQIAEKDVPYNLPYWIVEDSVVPEDKTYRNAWRISYEMESKPDGFGGESTEFDSEVLAKYLESVK